MNGVLASGLQPGVADMLRPYTLRNVRRVVLCLGLLLASLALPRAASAGELIFIPPDADVQDLDHHYVYTWLIRNIDTLLPGGVNSITGASLTFTNIENWTEQPNRLYLALLSEVNTTTATSVTNNNTTLLRIADGDTDGNTNVSSSIYRIQDDADLSNQNVAIRDDIAKDLTGSSMAGYYTTAGQKLIPSTTTGVTPLGNQFGVGNYGGFLTQMQEGWVMGALGDSDESFDDNPETFTLNFDAAALTALKAYIAADGDLAIGLDPDCHYDNDGLILKIFTENVVNPLSTVPEPATMSMLGLGLALVYYRRRRAQRS